VQRDGGSKLQYGSVGEDTLRRFSSSGAAWSFYRDNMEDEFKASRLSGNASRARTRPTIYSGIHKPDLLNGYFGHTRPLHLSSPGPATLILFNPDLLKVALPMPARCRINDCLPGKEAFLNDD